MPKLICNSFATRQCPLVQLIDVIHQLSSNFTVTVHNFAFLFFKIHSYPHIILFDYFSHQQQIYTQSGTQSTTSCTTLSLLLPQTTIDTVIIPFLSAFIVYNYYLRFVQLHKRILVDNFCRHVQLTPQSQQFNPLFLWFDSRETLSSQRFLFFTSLISSSLFLRFSSQCNRSLHIRSFRRSNI